MKIELDRLGRKIIEMPSDIWFEPYDVASWQCVRCDLWYVDITATSDHVLNEHREEE